jgi:GYF domain 2
MYRIIGADGREYGPITADQLRQWIREGRINVYSKVRQEGATEWKAASEFPEFAGSFTTPGTAPASPPPALLGAVEAEAMAQDFLARDYELPIGRCIGRGWDLVMANFWLTVGASLLIFLVSGAAGAIPFGGLLLNYVLSGGLDWLFLKLVRGQKAELGDAFAGFSLAFVPLMLFSLVSQLLTGLGFVLCLLPGIYLFVAWELFTALLILDKRLDFWPAMELSRKIITRHWWQVFGLALLFLLAMLAGSVVFCLGFFIALPIVKAAKVYAYEEIFGDRPAQAAAASGAAPALAPVPTPAPAAGSTPTPPSA